MKNKTFDCVLLKHQAAEKIYSLIKNMTPEQEYQYWKKRTEEFKKERKKSQISVSHRLPVLKMA